VWIKKAKSIILLSASTYQLSFHQLKLFYGEYGTPSHSNPEINHEYVVEVSTLRKCKILTQSMIGRAPAGFNRAKKGPCRRPSVLAQPVWCDRYFENYCCLSNQRGKILEDIEALRKDSLYSSLEPTYWTLCGKAPQTQRPSDLFRECRDCFGATIFRG